MVIVSVLCSAGPELPSPENLALRYIIYRARPVINLAVPDPLIGAAHAGWVRSHGAVRFLAPSAAPAVYRSVRSLVTCDCGQRVREMRAYRRPGQSARRRTSVHGRLGYTGPRLKLAKRV